MSTTSGPFDGSFFFKRFSKNSLVVRTLLDRKSTRLNSSHLVISYAVFCLKKNKIAHPLPALVLLHLIRLVYLFGCGFFALIDHRRGRPVGNKHFFHFRRHPAVRPRHFPPL